MAAAQREVARHPLVALREEMDRPRRTTAEPGLHEIAHGGSERPARAVEEVAAFGAVSTGIGEIDREQRGQVDRRDEPDRRDDGHETADGDQAIAQVPPPERAGP